jgi:hypothetical protein
VAVAPFSVRLPVGSAPSPARPAACRRRSRRGPRQPAADDGAQLVGGPRLRRRQVQRRRPAVGASRVEHRQLVAGHASSTGPPCFPRRRHRRPAGAKTNRYFSTMRPVQPISSARTCGLSGESGAMVRDAAHPGVGKPLALVDGCSPGHVGGGVAMPGVEQTIIPDPERVGGRTRDGHEALRRDVPSGACAAHDVTHQLRGGSTRDRVSVRGGHRIGHRR